jgi:hypothetical protein
MFDLRDKNEERKTTDKEEYRRFKQKERNVNQKKFAKTIGENFATFALLAIIALMVGFIWTEARIFTNWTKFIGDAVVTVTLYILADVCSAHLGSQGGKLDDDYIKCHNEYLKLRETVRGAGIVMMDMFCDWQIDVEYEYYLRRRCKDMKIDYKEYIDNYHGKTLEELQQLFPLEKTSKESEHPGFWKKLKTKLFGGIRNAKTSSKAAKVFALNQIDHIELTPDMLMTDGSVKNRRGGIGIGGEEYIKNNTVGWKHILITAIFAIVAAIPVFTLVDEFSVAMLIYTVFKIALMLYRMYTGWSRGSKGYNTVEPKFLQNKIKYLYLYLEFLDKKIYKELEDRYTVVGDDDDQAGWKAQVDEGGAGGHS